MKVDSPESTTSGLRKDLSGNHLTPKVWKLSTRAVLVLGALTLLFAVCVAVVIPAHEPWISNNCVPDPSASATSEVSATEGTTTPAQSTAVTQPSADYEAKIKAFVIVGVIEVLACAAACAAYLRVAFRAPRSIQLHGFGLALFMLLFQSMGTHDLGESVFGCSNFAASVVAAASSMLCHKFLVFILMSGKFAALVAEPSKWKCMKSEIWGACVACNLLAINFVSFSTGYLFARMTNRGLSLFDILGTLPKISNTEVLITDFEHGFLKVTIKLELVLSVALLLLVPIFTVTVCQRVWKAGASLQKRQVAGETLATVQKALRKNLVGGLLVMLSTLCLFAPAQIITLTFQARESYEEWTYTPWKLVVALQTLDSIADLVGILLLADMGALLSGSTEATGDVQGFIQSSFKAAAVETDRADEVFEGSVARTLSKRCIVSFPGKFIPEWKTLTKLCDEGEISSACVFLPTSDPKQRFGKHCDNPETPGKCWCHALYGEVKPWGCFWFEDWRQNVEKAVRLNLHLVVVYFPGQEGFGKVMWKDLGHSNLWNGEGLGGSQKGEVAWLMKNDWQFAEKDINAVRKLLFRRR